MRRRSYGNSVSARNRQRILLQAHRIKVRVMRTILMYNVGRDLRAAFKGKVVRLIHYLFVFEYYFLQHCLEYKIIILCYSL